MWRSKDDIVKDLAILNDFGVPGDQEPYQFLYSTGRGSKIKQKKMSEKFVDSRTGEVINVEELDVLNIFEKSKGRGTLLGNFSKSKLQLQQQLRMARPLGSGDEAVELYYRRNSPNENPKIQTNLFDYEPETVKNNVVSENSKAKSSAVESRSRVKAIRNSNLQCNALIANLLSKAKSNPNVKLMNDNCCNSDNDSNMNRSDEFKEQKSSLQDSDSEWNQEKDFSQKICDPCYQSAKKKNVLDEHFEIICDKEKEEKGQDRKRMSKENNEGETLYADEKKEERDEIYKKLGEISLSAHEINSKVNEKATYDFRKFLQCVTSLEKESENEFGYPREMSFIYNEYDFPPLRRN